MKIPLMRISVVLLFVLASGVAQGSPVQRLSEAIQFKTISYQDREKINYLPFVAFREYLEQAFPLVFSELDIEVVNGYSLLLRWAGTDAELQPVLFTGHYDVVPVEAGTAQDWHYPPFSGAIANGRIYGRGALDDKVGVMGLLEGIEQLLREGFIPARTLVFAFGHDEEIGGADGAKAMAAIMLESGDEFYWMVDEGGMIISDYPLLQDKAVALVNVAEKGYVTIRLRTTGEGGHSSNPPAVSTIGRLAAALTRIEENPFPPRLIEPVAAMLETIAPYTSQPERFIFSNLWLTGGLVASQMADDRATMPFVRTTTALTVVRAGSQENVIPQAAEALVNFRLLPGDTPAEVIESIERLIDDPLVEITYEQWDEIPKISDHNAQGFATIAEAVASVYPEVLVAPSMLMATTDTRHYVRVAENQYRFHGVMMTMEQLTSIHGTNEYVGEESYNNWVEVAREMLMLAAQ
ncbi:MAG: M20/M25/M40 family metallo-hydrolase [Pseudomonadota bacterium]